MTRVALWLIELTKPLVWRIASAYDIRVDKPYFPYGRHKVEFEDPREIVQHKIPRSCYFNTASGAIRIGAGTVFGEDVMLLTGKHLNIEEARIAGVELHHVPESGRDIHIGRNCYVGSGAILIGPLNIGDHSVIGAGAVVVKDVPAFSKAGGSPARILGTINPPGVTAQGSPSLKL